MGGLTVIILDFEKISDDIILSQITVETYKVTLYGLFAIMMVFAIGFVFLDGIITHHTKKKRKDWN